MTEQRLAGLSHQELWNLAHGGDPAASTTSQASFSRVAQALGNVSNTLRGPLAEFGLGWQGQAANAAHAGIAQHAQWAETAAARATLAGNQAMRQAASAALVIAEMPPPPTAPVGPAGTPGGLAHPVGPGPTGANWGREEEARVNARQRALELMQGHAAECQRNRPTTGFAPPASAGVAAAAARAGASAGRGVPAGPPRASDASRAVPGGSPSVGAGASTGRTAGGTGRAGSVTRAGATGDRSAGVPSTRPASVTPYPGAGSADAVVPEGVSAPVGPAGAERGDRAAPPSGSVVLPPRGGSAEGTPATRPGRTGGGSTSGPDLADPRSQGRGWAPGAGAVEASQIGGPQPGASQIGGPQLGAGQLGGGGTAERADPSGRSGAVGATGPATMVPPMLGGAALSGAGLGGGGLGDEGTDHRRPDYLLEESELFTDYDEWVAPPVIGS